MDYPNGQGDAAAERALDREGLRGGPLLSHRKSLSSRFARVIFLKTCQLILYVSNDKG